MIEALLTIYLASGAIVERPISQLDCERNLVVATETALSGGYASLDGPSGSFLIRADFVRRSGRDPRASAEQRRL